MINSRDRSSHVNHCKIFKEGGIVGGFRISTGDMSISTLDRIIQF